MPMPTVVYQYIGPNISRARRVQIALCTCPWCHTVWPHVENRGRDTYDLQRTKAQYGDPYEILRCDQCGEKSVAQVLPEKGRLKWTKEDYECHTVIHTPPKSR